MVVVGVVGITILTLSRLNIKVGDAGIEGYTKVLWRCTYTDTTTVLDIWNVSTNVVDEWQVGR